ncbi:SCO family protein [Methylobacter sp. YRD-M1]|uniref:SCO family protein n=1 Tax=Methylobacter sp. YRD-M1 TaxID=2911520 RepID=UPI00227C435E|nr:SCO family protein [Methylobacter sp. YRD-M1]WAK03325.1 SCO family protein [Methylobacter sp. YRD-M1]
MKNEKVQKVSAHSMSKMELRDLLLKALLPPPTQGRGGNQFPDVAVTSHTGETYRFYSDLIRDKVVLVQFMSIDSQKRFPSLEHFSQIAQRLGDKLGKEVSLYSITTDPERDTVERLAAYAEERRLPSGWHLLRSSEDDAKAISGRFARHLSRHHHHEGINMRMVHYGNGSVGLWGAFAADADPDMAVTRLSWLQNGSPAGSEVKRAGPVSLSQQKDKNSNRDV